MISVWTKFSFCFAEENLFLIKTNGNDGKIPCNIFSKINVHKNPQKIWTNLDIFSSYGYRDLNVLAAFLKNSGFPHSFSVENKT